MKFDYLIVGIVIISLTIFGCTESIPTDTMEKNRYDRYTHPQKFFCRKTFVAS